ncbi:hypothetical protein GCM10025857_22290 [Alicyclobacillus contaminans]|nr:hypothetical protein GCM10025857_22290 [Alicyclobacillus contaminans]
MKSKLHLDASMITRAREAARRIAADVTDFIGHRTTVAVERTVLRLFGVDGVDADGVPLPNVVVDEVQRMGRLHEGVAKLFVGAMLQTGWSAQALAEAVATGSLRLGDIPQPPVETVLTEGRALASQALARIRANRARREELLVRLGRAPCRTST